MGNFIINGAQALTEDLSFFRGFIVGCGEASALVIAHILKGTPLSVGQLTNLINSASSANQLSGAGFGQTAANVQWDLSKLGIQSTAQQFNAGKLDQLLKAGTPVELGVSNGGALSGEPGNLRGHYITLVGENSSGFVVADPNSAASKSGGFVTDTLQQLENANPFSMIVPSGTGPTKDCKCLPWDLACIAACATGLPIANPGSDSQALPDLGAAIGQGIQSGISSLFSNAGTNLSKQLGTKSFGDALWRALFIFVAVVLHLIGVAAIIFDFLDKSNVEVAGTRV